MSTTASAYRRVAPPLTPDATTPLPTDCKGIKLDQPLADDEYRQLAALLEDHPDKELFVLQLDSTHHEPIRDLRFLQFFPQLRIFAGTLELLESLDGIEHLQLAHTIVLHKAKHRMSAAPLAPLTALQDLWLDGQFTDREALRNLSGLTNFKMGYAAKIPNLNFLPPNLTRFSMNLGSVTDIGALADLPHLQRLLLHKVHGIANLTPLANATGLRYLYLADLREVTELFDMTNLTDLTEATIALPNLTELRPLLSAPNLTTLSVPYAPALDPTSWRDTCTGWLAQGKPPFWE